MLFRRRKAPFITINKQTPPLTLDQKWHMLFAEQKTKKMSALEAKLNGLLQEQGAATNEYKEYSQLKKQLLSQIITEMPEAFEGAKEVAITHMSKDKKYITEINQKLKRLETRLLKLPKEIEATNGELLDLSMGSCYEHMVVHKKVLDEIDPKIDKLREQLKELVAKKAESKEQYDALYAYMHDLVGPDVIEKYDQLYLGGKRRD